MSTANTLIDELRAHGQTIAFCESLTAGLAAATLASVPGASDVLRGGLITYATDVKVGLANVDKHVLEECGPVSPAVAREMARGARAACGADWAVALTGVAGPDPQDGHPVGEVWIGLAGPHWTASSAAAELVPTALGRFTLIDGSPEPVRVLAGDRNAIRAAAVEAALRGALTAVQNQDGTNANR
ncbi:nicotinamide-nucleotide amidohydrolase family protein [Corynebacterium aquatimens]|uniref:CinA family protein n=1 Tax=Corynebacterium TaxID=1716 RepID=UPI001F235EBF|nr:MULTISPECIES: nicotinamide-nucleotide amidohydrolase family protein [Corynebacterium]QYH19591.1 nicotinamide-nucleotide amidohydrolase family protein [Corynebacterium aquatimens]UIZ91433.1 nicotinamide-nucleotide amidohydrolase family protein [Corynebacterium sp. CNCTC7651]